MKVKIINEAKLPYKVIGQVIDDYLNDDRQTTIYYGKTELFTIDYKDILYRVQVRYLKRYIEYYFREYKEEDIK